jgi:hypothetical protein
MPSSYPAGYDTFGNPIPTDALDSITLPHATDQHGRMNDAMEAVQGALGLDPQGASATVRARLDGIDGSIGAAQGDADAALAALADKADLASPTFTGTVVLPTTTSIGDVDSTELSYLDGAASNIQDQLDAMGALIGAPMYREAVIPYYQPGELAVTTGISRFRFPFDATLMGVSLVSATAPTGTGPGIIVDVNINDVTVFTDQDDRPQIALTLTDVGEATVFGTGMEDILEGDYMTVDIDSVGSTLPGDDLTVIVRYRW